ncbi:MAG: diphthine--ammonia ligase [Candidatus Pacearchaeota archaeon]
MKVGVLFSGGKDSTLATFFARRDGYEISCLITIVSKNKDSFMFHTPSIGKTAMQAEAIGVPIVLEETDGEKEWELEDLKRAIKRARKEFGVEGIVSGAVESVYQSSRIQKVCNELGVECFNPLWQKNQVEILADLIDNKFEVIVVGAFAYPLDKSFLGKKIDKSFISEMKKLKSKWGISPAGEGGEYETFVLNCPFFERGLRVKSYKDIGERNSWRREIVIY